MMLLALAAKCGFFGASGLSASSFSDANRRSFKSEASPSVPRPTLQSLKNCRRVRWSRYWWKEFMAMILSGTKGRSRWDIHFDKLTKYSKDERVKQRFQSRALLKWLRKRLLKRFLIPPFMARRQPLFRLWKTAIGLRGKNSTAATVQSPMLRNLNSLTQSC